MPSDLLDIVRRFRGLRVLVIGEAMLDVYTRGSTDRLCREAPVPIIDAGREDVAPGGAANTAANLAALGARVSFVSAVGDDREGGRLLDLLHDCAVDVCTTAVEHGRQTLSKQRVLAGSQLLLRLDRGSTGRVAATTEQALVDNLEARFADADAIVISDYGYGILTPVVREALARLQSLTPRPVFCDAKDLTLYAGLRPTAVKPNYAEALCLLGATQTRDADRTSAIDGFDARLLDLTGADLVAVSLDAEGVLLLQSCSPPRRVPAHDTTASRGAGAGDAFLAALSLSLTAGGDSTLAARIAVAAASVAVRHDGTAICAREDLIAALDRETAPALDARHEVVRLVEAARLAGKRIVFTNGCFDILHSGHTRFLRAARAEGDLLVVGLNSDDSVRRLKGAERPVNTLADRAQVLKALSCVDHVVAFDEDTPDELLKAIRPHVFAKGGDYTVDRLPESELVRAMGGVVRILDYIDDHSTSGLIRRIRSNDSSQADAREAAPA